MSNPVLKKGVTAKITRRDEPVSILAARALGKSFCEMDVLQDLLGSCKALCWQAATEQDRFEVAESLLDWLLDSTNDIHGRNLGIAYTYAVDEIWVQYALEHKAAAEFYGDDEYPSILWIREGFAQQKGIKGEIAKSNPKFIQAYISRGWGHPKQFLRNAKPDAGLYVRKLDPYRQSVKISEVA